MRIDVVVVAFGVCAAVAVRGAAEIVGVCCGVVSRPLNGGLLGVVVCGAVEAVCRCAVVDGSRVMDIAGVIVCDVAKAVDVCLSGVARVI